MKKKLMQKEISQSDLDEITPIIKQFSEKYQQAWLDHILKTPEGRDRLMRGAVRINNMRLLMDFTMGIPIKIKNVA